VTPEALISRRLAPAKALARTRAAPAVSAVNISDEWPALLAAGRFNGSGHAVKVLYIEMRVGGGPLRRACSCICISRGRSSRRRSAGNAYICAGERPAFCFIATLCDALSDDISLTISGEVVFFTK
jgi:hypothetical protein